MTKSNTLKEPATTLEKIIRHVGLDVHKDTIAVAVAEKDGEPCFLRDTHDLHALEKLVKKVREGGKYQTAHLLRGGADGVRAGRSLQDSLLVARRASGMDDEMLQVSSVRLVLQRQLHLLVPCLAYYQEH